MPRDVFISYSHHNRLAADAVCAKLEQSKVRCWMAPRDILPGQEYGRAIIEAMDTVKVLVLVLSAQSNDSRFVKLEVERAVSKGVVVIPFRIEDVKPGPSLELFVGATHWLDALTPPLEAHIGRLVDAVLPLVGLKMGDLPPAVSATGPALLSARSSDDPLLVFEYGSGGWTVRNVGKSTAMDVLIAQKRVGGGWFKPVRVPPLEVGREFPLGWCLHVNDTGLGACYASPSGTVLSVRCGNDRNTTYLGSILPQWTDEQIERHWNVTPYEPGSDVNEVGESTVRTGP